MGYDTAVSRRPDTTLRRRAALERLRESIVAAATTGLIIGVAIGALLGSFEGPTLVQGDADRQFTILTSMLPGVMTVVGVVISIMVVNQQLASQQYSPRAIRTAMRDRPTRWSLGGLFAYIGYMLGAIVVFGSSSTTPVSVPVAMVLSVVALGLVAYLVQHISDGFRADRLVSRIGRDTAASVARIADRDSDDGDLIRSAEDLDAVPEDAAPLHAWVSGHLQDVVLDGLTDELHALGAVVRLDVQMGAFVGARTRIGWCWRRDGEVDVDAVTDALERHILVGDVRTTEREIGIGVQQLLDMALKALSPGINDPETAVEAVNTLTHVLQPLAARQQRWLVGRRGEHAVIVIPRPLVWDLVDDVVSAVRRVAGAHPTVLSALAMLLHAVSATRPAEAERADPHLDALIAEVEAADLLTVDVQRVRAVVEAARAEIAAVHARAAHSDAGQRTLDG